MARVKAIGAAVLAVAATLAAGRAARAAGDDDSRRGRQSSALPSPSPEVRNPSEGSEDNDEAEAEAEEKQAAGTPGGDACIDEEVKADLFAKRRQRTSRDRLFQQTNRHELTVQGGYYVSDLFDGTYTFGGAYAYHMTEDLAVEATGAYTRLASSGGPELERTFAVLGNLPRRQLSFDADLVWSFAHAKMRFGGSIDHFDIYVAAGAGVVDSVLSANVAGNGGFGLKFFLGRAIAFRFDVRDHVFREQLLSQILWVNDLSVTAGFSVYLPVRE